MIKIIFYVNEKKYIGFECLGHAEYSKYGKDVLCAAVSGITQAACLGVLNVLNISANISKDDEKGYLKLVTPKNLSDEEIQGSNLILKTAYVSLKDLESGYPKHIKIEEKSYVY